MHLEELFQYIEERRSEFIANRAAKTCFTGSAAGTLSPGENKAEKSPAEQIETVLTEVAVATGT